MITIKLASDEDHLLWSQYIELFPSLNHGYSWHWREIISKSFGHIPKYLIATNDKDRTSKHQAVVGVLPMFFINSFLFGRALISLPYLNSGGIVADTDQIEALLYQNAIELSKELDCNYVELRCRALLSTKHINATVRSHKVAMVLDLAKDPDSMFSSFSSKLRSQIKRPTKSGVMVRELSATGSKEEELDLRDFYTVFSENMRDLGTPVYPKKLFFHVKNKFAEDARIVCAYKGNQPLAAGFIIKNQNNAEILWASSIRKYNNLSANMLLYWHAIKSSIEENCDVFDFGRSSPNSGTYKFKEQWGAKPLELHWHYHLNKGTVPDVNPNSPKFSMLVRCWQHMPLWLANSVGPILTKGLP